MSNKSKPAPSGSPEWNDAMYSKHPTPYFGIAGWIEKLRVQTIIRIIRTQVKNEHFKLLEIGCEAGNLLNAIHLAFPRAQLTGFDISTHALEAAKCKLSDQSVTFLQGDITQPNSLKTGYDIIVCSETLEHIPDYQAAVQNIAELGAEDTLFIFTVPLESLKNRIKYLLNKLGLFDLFFRGIEKGMSEWHVNDFSKSEFHGLLSSHFEILEYRQLLGLHQIATCSGGFSRQAKKPNPKKI